MKRIQPKEKVEYRRMGDCRSDSNRAGGNRFSRLDLSIEPGSRCANSQPGGLGLYITVFMFLVGLSAGGLIVASSGEVFGAKHLKPLAPIAIWLSFVCVGLAALSIIPDLGEPGRVWKIFTNAQWNSPFVWDLAIILVYLVLSGVYLGRTQSRRAARLRRPGAASAQTRRRRSWCTDHRLDLRRADLSLYWHSALWRLSSFPLALQLGP
jgi:hypothetical protein